MWIFSYQEQKLSETKLISDFRRSSGTEFLWTRTGEIENQGWKALLGDFEELNFAESQQKQFWRRIELKWHFKVENLR